MTDETRAAIAPFQSLNELDEARIMLAAGKTGRAIAAWFGIEIGRVAEWVGRERESAA